MEAEQLGPPEEELLGPPETVQVQERTAPVQEPTASATPAAAEASVVGVVLPIDSEPSATPKRSPAVEPAAPNSAPLVADVLQSPPKLRRLLQKTSVPEHVCPPGMALHNAWETATFEVTEDFVSKAFFYKLDGKQRYNLVYEKLRSFLSSTCTP